MNILFKVLRIAIGILISLYLLNLILLFGFIPHSIVGFWIYAFILIITFPLSNLLEGIGMVRLIDINNPYFRVNMLVLLIYILILYFIYKMLLKKYDKNSN